MYIFNVVIYVHIPLEFHPSLGGYFYEVIAADKPLEKHPISLKRISRKISETL